MAKVYPDFYKGESSAERKVFDYLKLNAPDDWVVINSFNTHNTNGSVYGEIDFIIIAPNLGIVVLEIKGGKMELKNKTWINTDRTQNRTVLKRSPFVQARNGRFSLSNLLENKLGESFSRNNMLFASGVIFTDQGDLDKTKLIEEKEWMLHQKSDYGDYIYFIKNLIKKTQELHIERQNSGVVVPTLHDVQKILEVLVPFVSAEISLEQYLVEDEKKIKLLTEEQCDILDSIEGNKRVLINGGAGTGKTFVALEEAKTYSYLLDKICVLCFNKQLSKFLKDTLKNYNNIEVYTFHGLIFKVFPYTASEEWFNISKNKNKIISAFQKNIKFNKIIVDETQDLLNIDFLDIVNVLLEGGLENGNFTFYGDFSQQAIYETNCDNGLKYLEGKTHISKFSLRTNCRNTQHIGRELVRISGFSQTKYLSNINGEVVDYYEWKTIEEQKNLIKDSIRFWSKELPNTNIIFLSPFKRTNSVIHKIDPEEDIILEFDFSKPDRRLSFSTIKSFKGLENSIIFLVDIETYKDKKLMYVALSRARTKLIIFESTNAKIEREEEGNLKFYG